MYIVFWKTWSHSVVWLQTFHFFYRGTLDSMTDDVITNFKLVMTIWLSNVLKEMRGGGWQRRWNFRVKSSSKILFLLLRFSSLFKERLKNKIFQTFTTRLCFSSPLLSLSDKKFKIFCDVEFYTDKKVSI